MAFVPIRIDRTSKPPLGTPLRSDGHWSVQGLVGAWALNEGAGGTCFDLLGKSDLSISGLTRSANGLKNSSSGQSAQSALSTKSQCPLDNTLTVIVTPLTGDSQSFWNDGYIEIYRTYGAAPNSLVYQVTTAAGDWRVYSSTNLSNGSRYVVSGAYDAGGIHDLLLNGAVVGSKDAYALGANYNGSTSSVSILNATSGGNTSEIELALLHNVALSVSNRQSLSANPWQIYEPETVWIEVGGGAESALFAGTIYGQSSVSAQLSTAIAIASQVVAVGSISGGINTAIRLATSTQGSALASALLTTAIRMAAGAQGHGASTADLSTTIALAADILAASSASGTLSTAIRFGGALSGASTTTAALTNAIALAAQAAGLGSISGQLAGTVAAALFAGTIQGSSSASANLSTAVILAAAAQGNSTAQATLSTALELAAQVNGIGSAAGTLGADISGLAGSLDGSSEAQATLATAIHLMGVAAGQCGIIGRLAEPVEILAQLRVMASDPLALTISVRDPLTLNIAVST